MYWRHFDLSAEPFSLTPDPAFLYLSSVHAEAFAALTVGLRERRGLIAMIGEVGTGKTTLVYSLLSQLGPEIHTAYISNARLSFDGILRSALRDFSVECDSVHSADLLDAFNRFLNRCAEDGSTAALVIDEAQNLSRDTFEDLRLLTNFETYKHKLLQIVLVGQPELDSKLRDPSLRQVADRIAVRCHVNPLTPHEVRQYLQHRLSAAGGSIEIFSEAAVRALVRCSRGIPRSINILGHNAMLFAYGAGRGRVNRGDVTSAVKEREGRGLIRFEARLPRFLSRKRADGTRAGLSYTQLLLGGVAAGLVFFALGASGAKFLRNTAPAAPTASKAPQPEPRATNAPASRPKPAERATASSPKPSARANDATASNEAREATKTRTTVAPVVPPAPSSETAPAPTPPPASTPPKPLSDAATEASPPAPANTGGRTSPTTRIEPSAADRMATAETPTAPAPAVATPNGDAPVATARPSEVAPPLEIARPVPLLSPLVVPAPSSSAVQRNASRSDVVRVVQVNPGSSLYDLMTNIYGAYDPRYVPRIQAMNPQMTDPNHIMAGDELRFPEDLAEAARKQNR